MASADCGGGEVEMEWREVLRSGTVTENKSLVFLFDEELDGYRCSLRVFGGLWR